MAAAPIKKKTTFQSLKLSDCLIKQLNTMGIKNPSEIQAKAIPVIKSGMKRKEIGIKSEKEKEKGKRAKEKKERNK